MIRGETPVPSTLVTRTPPPSPPSTAAHQQHPPATSASARSTPPEGGWQTKESQATNPFAIDDSWSQEAAACSTEAAQCDRSSEETRQRENVACSGHDGEQRTMCSGPGGKLGEEDTDKGLEDDLYLVLGLLDKESLANFIGHVRRRAHSLYGAA